MSGRLAHKKLADVRAEEKEAERKNIVRGSGMERMKPAHCMDASKPEHSMESGHGMERMNPAHFMDAFKPEHSMERGHGATPSTGLSQFRGGTKKNYMLEQGADKKAYMVEMDEKGKPKGERLGLSHKRTEKLRKHDPSVASEEDARALLSMKKGSGTKKGQMRKTARKAYEDDDEAHEMGRHMAEHVSKLHGDEFLKKFHGGMSACMGGKKHTLIDHLEHPTKGFGHPLHEKGGVRTGQYEGKGKVDGRKARAEIVKKVMAEKKMSMVEASKYVKEHGLYKKD